MPNMDVDLNKWNNKFRQNFNTIHKELGHDTYYDDVSDTHMEHINRHKKIGRSFDS